MANLVPYKVAGALPDTLVPNALYALRVGAGFRLFIADATGSIAHPLAEPVGSPAEIYLKQSAYVAITTPDPASRYFILPESSPVVSIILTGAETEVHLTQAAYDALSPPDPGTLYRIVEE